MTCTPTKTSWLIESLQHTYAEMAKPTFPVAQFVPVCHLTRERLLLVFGEQHLPGSTGQNVRDHEKFVGRRVNREFAHVLTNDPWIPSRDESVPLTLLPRAYELEARQLIEFYVQRCLREGRWDKTLAKIAALSFS